ncbi:hypothetical protein ACH9L7_05430 [Haloferax sp. S1W]|uniref:hypothetical protein n=1 Tax=Haloferax sp. S1W TaxID=3377110 RepID=UPI0037CB7D06
MAIYIPSYLRPLSDTRTGYQSRLDQKAEDVDLITAPELSDFSFKQLSSVPVWVNEQAYHGRDTVTSDREIKIEHDVDHPERHWWIISDEFLESLDPALREHADIFDLLIALNLCIDDPVYFSQSPGQTTSGAYEFTEGALRYRSGLSIGNFATALLGMNEIPSEVEVGADLLSVFQSVRKYRSKRMNSDAEIDLRVALHMYDDALDSDIWTVMANMYYVCENILAPEYNKKDQVISEHTNLTKQEAANWREVVNRIKHPDKEEGVQGLLEQGEVEAPTLRRIRKSANTVLKGALVDLEEQ